MKYTVEDSFYNFKPWSGAVKTYERIIDEGKADEADIYFTDHEPEEGWTDTAINDLLWFESEAIYKAIGMKPDDTETHDAAAIMEAWKAEQDEGVNPVRIEFDDDAVRIIYTDEEDAEIGEQSDELDAEDVAALFGADVGEIDADAQTVETWDE